MKSIFRHTAGGRYTGTRLVQPYHGFRPSPEWRGRLGYAAL